MSAIYGIIDLHQRPIPREWLEGMRGDLAHRAVDGHKLYEDEESGVALGHCALHVTPESVHERGPFALDGCVITADARLDERAALMDRVSIPAADRERVTDPELLLRAYLADGPNFVKSIYGDFAFAIWDGRKKHVFCARDQMGIRPFLYHLADGRLAFSSELRALVRLPCVETEMDFASIRTSVTGYWPDIEKTHWLDVKRLPDAGHMTLDQNGPHITRYWRPRARLNKAYLDPRDAVAALRSAMSRAVLDRCRVTGDAGLLMSGGLDSGAIACMVAPEMERRGGQLISVSSVLDPDATTEGLRDERELIGEIHAQHPKISGEFVVHSELPGTAILDELLRRHYAPPGYFYDVDELMCKRLAARGVRRVLSGVYGDNTVSNWGIDPLPLLLRGGRLGAFFTQVKNERRRKGTSTWRIIRNRGLRSLIPMPLIALRNRLLGREHAWSLAHYPYRWTPGERQLLLNARRRMYGLYDVKNASLDMHLWPPPTVPFYEYYDVNGGAHGLEFVFPWADRRVVELLLEFPAEHFTMNGEHRGLMRAVMKDILPDKVRTSRHKGLYSPGFGERFKNNNIYLQQLIEQTITNPYFKDWLNAPELKKLTRKLELKHEQRSSGQVFYSLSYLTVVLAFVRAFNKS